MKGTRQGVLVRISEDCPWSDALQQLRDAFEERPAFFGESPLSLDLGWRELQESEVQVLTQTLEETRASLLGVISTSHATRQLFESRGVRVIIGTLGLAKHGGRRGNGAATGKAAREQPASAPADTERNGTAAQADSANSECTGVRATDVVADPTLMIRKTVRSGQRIEFTGNVVILGDVNAGAEIRAGGDVVVLGALRGIAHAGTSGKKEAVVVALNVHAAQVRIADLVGTVKAHKSFHHNSAVMVKARDGSVSTVLYGS